MSDKDALPAPDPGSPAPDAPAPTGEGPACGWCSEPIGVEAVMRTCASCGALYHRDCAARSGRCADETCDLARPSHPAWTIETRAEGWLLVPAPRPSGWLRPAMVCAVLPIAGFPGGDRVVAAGQQLIGQGAIEPWMLISVAMGLAIVPWAAVLTLAGLENATQRGALLDAHGALFDHSPTWRGARLTWDDMVGFRITAGGVRLVVRGRPWTRFVGPTIPCEEGQLMHQVVETLERRGVRRYDA